MDKIDNIITLSKLDKYFNITEKAFNEISEIIPKKTHLYNIFKDFLIMAKSYFNDAKHFKEKGDYVNAFAALNYAYGWIDAGARLGLYDVKHNNKLFTVD